MADPVVSSLALGLTAIGFIANLPRFIESILNDKDRYKDFGEELVPLLFEIRLVSNRLEIWKKFWRIHDQSPSGLLVRYWGPSGAKHIWLLLSAIIQKIKDIRTEFRARYGSTFAPAGINIFDDENASDETHFSEDSATKRLKAHRKLYKKHFGFRHRAKDAFYRSKKFRTQLDNLKTLIGDLESGAINEFIQEWQCEANEVNMKAQDKGYEFLVSELVERSTQTSQTLLKLLGTTRGPVMDFDIHQWRGISLSKRYGELDARVAAGRLPYYFQSTPAGSPIETSFYIIIRPEDPRHDIQSTFEDLDPAMALVASGADAEAYIRQTGASTQFHLSKVPSKTGKSRPLRELLQSKPTSTLIQSSDSDFSSRDRIKVAFELAHCALLFLKTDWFSRCCSCCVQRAEVLDNAEDEEYEYSVRMTKVEHLSPDPSGAAQGTQWCEAQLFDMHIRRLGVVLVEIALGMPMKDVSCAPDSGQISFRHLGDAHTGGAQSTCLPREISRRVEQAAGEDFSRAVEYCLRQRTKPSDIGPNEISRFFRWVIKPLSEHYEKRVLERHRMSR